jgi:hypothetical protein
MKPSLLFLIFVFNKYLPTRPGLYEGYSIKWSPNRTTYSYNDIIHFQCDAGYQLSGPSSLVCQVDVHETIGHWSNKQPACVGKHLLNTKIKNKSEGFI